MAVSVVFRIVAKSSTILSSPPFITFFLNSIFGSSVFGFHPVHFFFLFPFGKLAGIHTCTDLRGAQDCARRGVKYTVGCGATRQKKTPTGINKQTVVGTKRTAFGTKSKSDTRDKKNNIGTKFKSDKRDKKNMDVVPPRVGPPRRLRLRRVWPRTQKTWGNEEWGPEGWGAPNCALFFPLPPSFSLFFSLWRFSRGILVVFLKRRAIKCARPKSAEGGPGEGGPGEGFPGKGFLRVGGPEEGCCGGRDGRRVIPTLAKHGNLLRTLEH